MGPNITWQVFFLVFPQIFGKYQITDMYDSVSVWYLRPLLLTRIRFNSSMDKYMPRKVWGEITYPFLNFNGCTVEV